MLRASVPVYGGTVWRLLNSSKTMAKQSGFHFYAHLIRQELIAWVHAVVPQNLECPVANPSRRIVDKSNIYVFFLC